MRNFIFTLVLLSVLVSTAHAKQFEVENCESSAIGDINWAVDFIDKNIDEMLSQASFIPTKYGDEIKKKWPTSTLK